MGDYFDDMHVGKYAFLQVNGDITFEIVKDLK